MKKKTNKMMEKLRNKWQNNEIVWDVDDGINAVERKEQ